MPYHPAAHHRRSIRLQGYDYARAGVYFVTLVTRDRECLFGEVKEAGEMALNDLGRIVLGEWDRSAEIRREIELDAFVVMPNHVHGVVVIVETDDVVGATGRSPLRRSRLPGLPHGPAKRSLGAFVAGFKSAATKRINETRGTPRRSVWQRNYYEHIIRDDVELERIRAYIVNNPRQWALDAENPSRRRR